MLSALRARTIARDALAVLAFLALSLTTLFPPGYMPGSRLAQAMVLCSGQMPAGMAMDAGDHRRPDKVPHGGADHPCPFAVSAATPLVPDVPLAGPVSPPIALLSFAAPAPSIAPGRGMAAPPPPSHAPPAFRL